MRNFHDGGVLCVKRISFSLNLSQNEVKTNV